jgi:hypothetical protein
MFHTAFRKTSILWAFSEKWTARSAFWGTASGAKSAKIAKNGVKWKKRVNLGENLSQCY